MLCATMYSTAGPGTTIRASAAAPKTSSVEESGTASGPRNALEVVALPTRVEPLVWLPAECDHHRSRRDRVRLAHHGGVVDGDDERRLSAHLLAVELELRRARDDEVQLLLLAFRLVVAADQLVPAAAATYTFTPAAVRPK